MDVFLPSSGDLLRFSTELALLLSMLAVLVTPMVWGRRDILVVAIAAATGLGITLLAAIFTRWPAMENPGLHFGGMLVHDGFSWAVKLILVGAMCIVMALWYADSHDKFIGRDQAHDAPEFFMQYFAMGLGLCLMACTTNLMMIFAAIELVSLPGWVLTAFRRGHRPGAQAAMKLALASAASTAVMLYGMSVLYGVFGTLEVQAMGAGLRNGEFAWNASSGAALALGLGAMLAGIGGKFAMAPLHFWCPDVFEGANFDAATFMCLGLPTAGVALLTRVMLALTGPAGADGVFTALPVTLMVLGAVTALWGSLAAVRQTNVKRLLAWSTMMHAGFMLIALAAILSPSTGHGYVSFLQPIYTSPAAEAVLEYLFLLLFMHGGTFVTAAAIAQRLTGPGDAGMSLGVDRATPAGPPGAPTHGTGEEIRQYAGLSHRAPLLSATMLLFLLSLAGLPLTIGFSSRLKILTVLFDTGSVLGWAGVGVVAVSTLIMAASYFRIIREMYFVSTDLPRLIEIAPVSVVAMVLLIPNVVLFAAYGWVDHQARRHAEIVYSRALLVSPPDALGLKTSNRVASP